ncbi:hypothetical protein [Bacillus sp. B15-48]|uniref:hypothetical protein n=1 Tax=Bacillus sp. B15-48 TaxID=1548601 RepID=UPI00193FF494|nr:hypothetical protein [Bacillus sp. B15-48]MBM4761368.1 hypothetical protein [Bacillus sp. B15-48]
MDSSLLTVALLVLLVFMMFKCGKSMAGKKAGCCGPKVTSKTTSNELVSKLDHIEKQNEILKKEINERK